MGGILETAQSLNSSFPFLFEFGLGFGTWTPACQYKGYQRDFGELTILKTFMKRSFSVVFVLFIVYSKPKASSIDVVRDYFLYLGTRDRA